MDKTEAIRLALAELGEPSAETLAIFVQARYGITIPAGIIPIIKATLRDREQLERARAARTVPMENTA